MHLFLEKGHLDIPDVDLTDYEYFIAINDFVAYRLTAWGKKPNAVI